MCLKLQVIEVRPPTPSVNALEIVSGIYPAWLDKLRRLLDKGTYEFIGSGYAQIIGPLVSAEVNIEYLYFQAKKG